MNNGQPFILAIDQSTSATKGTLFNRNGGLVHTATAPHRTFYPQPGFVEHDPEEIFDKVVLVIRKLVREAGIRQEEVAGLAITNQRETVVVWDRQSGKPVGNAMVWQCQRGAGYCGELRKRGAERMIREKTGLLIDPYFSASKLHWLMENDSGLKARAKAGKLLLGTMDSWLLWKLTGGAVHATDLTNACRTLLFNIRSLQWDEELIGLFGLHRSMFPEVRFSDELFGTTLPGIVPNAPLAVAGLMGDSHAALFGQHCFERGMGKATYGTGSSVMMNIGTEPLDPPDGLVTSIGFGRKGQVAYVFEGNIHATGDTIRWLMNELQLIDGPEEAETLASSLPDNGGVYLVPAFSGLGAPYWDNDARACISGLARNATRAHLARAALEGIAYQVRDLIGAMERPGGPKLDELRVDGGPTRNRFLMQFQSDMLRRRVVPASIAEVSALGTAYMAGLAFGVWNGPEEIASLARHSAGYDPGMEEKESERLYRGWTRAVARARLQ